MVRMLLDMDAERKPLDSDGRTPKQLAKHLNHNGSHHEVIQALRRPKSQRRKKPVKLFETRERDFLPTAQPIAAATVEVERSLCERPAANGTAMTDAGVQCDLGLHRGG
mmetsp:Transcript_49747/g.144648  ORF Transcript_49747/g.144648 Transcript_49747/m.144648 type:complete len:109 (+) Transcript_49747:77-403(+)